mgnify:CR=1 FL=1
MEMDNLFLILLLDLQQVTGFLTVKPEMRMIGLMEMPMDSKLRIMVNGIISSLVQGAQLHQI